MKIVTLYNKCAFVHVGPENVTMGCLNLLVYILFDNVMNRENQLH